MIFSWVPAFQADPTRYQQLAPLFARLGMLRQPEDVTTAEPGEGYRRATVLAGLRSWLVSVQSATRPMAGARFYRF